MKAIIKRVVSGTIDDERVLIEILEDCNMMNFLLFNRGAYEKEFTDNTPRHIYLFGSLEVHAGDYVSIYTRKKRTNDDNSFTNRRRTTTYQLFWGIDDILWSDQNSAAYLIHYDDWMKKTIED